MASNLPFYLQGTQTAGLFQPAPQTSLPPVTGNYIPGNGMAPYANQPQAGSSYIPSINMGMKAPQNSFNDSNYAKAHDILNSPSASAENKFWAQNLLGTLSGLSGGNLGAAGVTAQSSTNNQSGSEMTSLANKPFPTGPLDQYFGGQGYGGGGSGDIQSMGSNQNAQNGNKLPTTQSPLSNQNATPNFNTSSSLFTPQTTANPSYQPQQGGNMSGGQGGALQMQPASSQDALNAYKNTAGYQLTNAPGAYQQSPGYQYAMDQAIQQAQGNASAHGLLESGSALRGFNSAVQGVAAQDYGNWWNRQNQQFNDYQNRLAGLAGGNVGGDQAFALGQGMGANTMQTGSNVASLLGNQGAGGYGGMVNTGAALSNNINNAGAQQAQINSANQSTQLAGAVYNRGLF